MGSIYDEGGSMVNIAKNAEDLLTESVDPKLRRRLGILGVSLAGLTLFLMALGSATRVWNAGLSCPDWPLCYGSLLPHEQMNWQVFLEWFHRWVATGVGILALVQMGWAWRRRQALPTWAVWGSTAAVGLVMVQGILGGLTVTELLRFDIVTAHLGTGLLFFSTTLALGLSLLVSRRDPADITPPPSNVPTETTEASDAQVSSSPPSLWAPLPWVGLGAALLVYLQSLLGALVASQWALHQCLASDARSCWVMNSHLIGVIPATVGALAVVGCTWRFKKVLPKPLKAFGHLAATCLIAQVALGIGIYRMHLQLEPMTVAHQAVGALLLGSLVAFTTLSFWAQSHTLADPRPAMVTQG